MTLLLALAGSLLASGAARAEPLPYRGPHPLDGAGHWHLEESVHVHDSLPVGDAPFANVDGVRVFLDDPSAYLFEGGIWAYAGIHPLPPRIGGTCGIEGEHRHPFVPEGDYREAEGVYRYVGAFRGGPSYVPERIARGERAPSATTPPRAAPPPAYGLACVVDGVLVPGCPAVVVVDDARPPPAASTPRRPARPAPVSHAPPTIPRATVRPPPPRRSTRPIEPPI